MAVRVVIADDSFLVREALSEVLSSAAEVDVVAVAEDVPSLVAAVERENPDVVLTDIQMPPFDGAGGIRFAADLRSISPETGVVILSQYAEADFALELFETGSARRAYLLKERVGNRAELVAAITAVAGGGSVVDPKIVDTLIAAQSRGEGSALADLTPREREVLAEVAKGKSNLAIAGSLFLTKRAVEKHINAIFLKLNLRGSDDVSSRVTATLIFLAEERPVPHPPVG